MTYRDAWKMRIAGYNLLQRWEDEDGWARRQPVMTLGGQIWPATTCHEAESADTVTADDNKLD